MDNVLEWIDQFNLEWNNIMSNQAPNLDVYEQSRFLTQALEQIVVQLYNGSGVGGGFESKELIRRYLANLIRKKKETLTQLPVTVFNRFKEYSVPLDNELLVIISELAVIENTGCETDKMVKIVPIKYDEVNEVLNNPFRGPSGNKVIRLDLTTHDVVLISKHDLSGYVYEYLKKPHPIILDDFSTYGTPVLEIDGLSNTQTPICELDSSLHRTIISQAVQLAATAWADKK